jgi:hypothetical protein
MVFFGHGAGDDDNSEKEEEPDIDGGVWMHCYGMFCYDVALDLKQNCKTESRGFD